MIKQIPSNEVEEYVKNNPKSILLDVRTEEEWGTDGKPDGNKIGLKTYCLTRKDDNFINDFKKLLINQEYEILSICKAGQRSQFVTELLTKENYNCVNIYDGFDGWKNSNLPCL